MVGVFEPGLVDHKHCDLGNGSWGPSYKIVHRQSKTWENITHATAVAGIIGAHTNNNGCFSMADTSKGGVAGIAGGWGTLGGDASRGGGASILSYDYWVGGTNKANDAELTKCLLIASSKSTGSNYGHGIHIGNFSIRSLVPRSQHVALEEAYDFAHRNDVALVAARGNFEQTHYFLPGSFAHHKVTSVGASEKNEYQEVVKTNYSDYGREMDLLAPAPLCLSNQDDNIIKTTYKTEIEGGVVKSKWGCFDGTSASAPQVAGAYALIHAYAQKNGWTVYPEDYEGMIKASAMDITGSGYNQHYDEKSGWGQLDIKKLFFMLQSGYKLYHFSNLNWQDFTYGTYPPRSAMHSILVSNTLNDPLLVPAEHWNVRIRPVTFTANHDLQWLDNGSNKIYVWGRKGPNKLYSGFGWPPSKAPEGQGYTESGTELLFQNGYTGVLSGYGGNISTESMMIHDNTWPTYPGQSHSFTLRTYQYKFDKWNGDFERPLDLNLGLHYTVFAKPIPPLSVEKINENIEILVFPTEASTIVTIQSDVLNYEGIKLSVLNSIGEELFTHSSFISNRYKIDVTNFPAGMYFITLNNSVSRVTKQFVVVK